MLLHTDVPNVAGRAMGKKDGQNMDEGEGTGIPSQTAGHLPDVTTITSTTAALLTYSSGGGCLLLTGVGTKPEITNE